MPRFVKKLVSLVGNRVPGRRILVAQVLRLADVQRQPEDSVLEPSVAMNDGILTTAVKKALKQADRDRGAERGQDREVDRARRA